jgi:hypothetical protein
MLAVGLYACLASYSFWSLKVKLKMKTGAALQTNCNCIEFTLFRLNSFMSTTFMV